MSGSGLVGLLGLAGCTETQVRPGFTKAKVIVIGGGFAGSTAAKHLHLFNPNLDITLIEANARYTTGPGSNWVLAGLRDISSIRFNYVKLAQNYGIRYVQDTVTAVDADKQQVHLQTGAKLDYDRLIVAPGTDFRWDTIEGYTPEIANTLIPHASKGAAQLELLHKQLQTMKNGRRVVISVPAAPYSCLVAPYERISLIAHYLKQHKPRSRILVLDSKDNFAQQSLFESGWKKLYRYKRRNSLIQWRSLSKGGKVVAVDAKKQRLITEFDHYKGDVLNVIPPQKAAALADMIGLSDASGWCPVNPQTFESTQIPKIHVIGDAAQASPMPKSAFSANSQAKSCAATVAALLDGKTLPTPSWLNTCYSLIGPQYGISNTMIYRLDAKGQIFAMPDAGGDSPANSNKQLEAVYADSWYNNITQNSFA
ncbi:FCSD flavin-binding domain-containing protein [Candidatus Venteria ishoeyi]